MSHCTPHVTQNGREKIGSPGIAVTHHQMQGGTA